MLTGLDETMRHQAPLTFAEVASTDHRFFDRVWFCAYHPEGTVGLITGMGSYTNMNVLDGFAAIQRSGRQHNLRLSRALRPAVDHMGVGPLRVEVVEPLQVLRLVLEPDDRRPEDRRPEDRHPHQGLGFDLFWSAVGPARTEEPHAGRLDGRLYQEYLRYSQIGEVNGWLSIDDERYEVEHWFGARDHSWGVRRGVGGFEPFTGSLPPEAAGSLFLWLALRAGDATGLVWAAEDGDSGRLALDGSLYVAGEERRIIELHHDLTFRTGGRAYERARIVLYDHENEEWVVEAEPLLSAWAYRGTGYDRGWTDGQGLGAWRGVEAREADVYGVADLEDVVFPDGVVGRPAHREQPVRLTLNGVDGRGHLPVITVGRVHRYELA